MEDRERLAWLGLCWGAEIGPAGFARLMAAYGSALKALEASEQELIQGPARLKPSQAKAIPSVRADLEKFAQLAEDVRLRGAEVLFYTDRQYPDVLHELPHPPPIICIKGRILPADKLAVAIVGTRSPTSEGDRMARGLASCAVSEGLTVVSGLARGIDTAAHIAALERNGRTIAIIGSGIANITPPENLELAERIAASGAVISELSPTAEPTIPNLMARNRLIALFSCGVIVVECRATGGSLATAQAALQQGRKLYAVQWPEAHELREGNQELLQQGATPLTSPLDMRWISLQLRSWQPPEKKTEDSAPQSQLSLF